MLLIASVVSNLQVDIPYSEYKTTNPATHVAPADAPGIACRGESKSRYRSACLTFVIKIAFLMHIILIDPIISVKGILY